MGRIVIQDLNKTQTPNANSHGSRRRRRSPVECRPNAPDGRSMVVKFPSRNLVNGRVKILKRGEEVVVAVAADLELGSTKRLGPEPEMVQRQIKALDSRVAFGVYAGSAVTTSPSPSSLPVPVFLESSLRRISMLQLV